MESEEYAIWHCQGERGAQKATKKKTNKLKACKYILTAHY